MQFPKIQRGKEIIPKSWQINYNIIIIKGIFNLNLVNAFIFAL